MIGFLLTMGIATGAGAAVGSTTKKQDPSLTLAPEQTGGGNDQGGTGQGKSKSESTSMIALTFSGATTSLNLQCN